MTDFTHARNLVCPECLTEYCDQEGYNCDCLLPRVPFNFGGETFEIPEHIYEEIISLRDVDELPPDEWEKAVEKILIDMGLIVKRPLPKEVHGQNGDEFLRKWQEAKKEVPPEHMCEAYGYLVGTMAGYIPSSKAEEIISCVLKYVKQ